MFMRPLEVNDTGKQPLGLPYTRGEYTATIQLVLIRLMVSGTPNPSCRLPSSLSQHLSL